MDSGWYAPLIQNYKVLGQGHYVGVNQYLYFKATKPSLVDQKAVDHSRNCDHKVIGFN